MVLAAVTPAAASQELLAEELCEWREALNNGKLHKLSVEITFNDQGWPRLVESSAIRRREPHRRPA